MAKAKANLTSPKTLQGNIPDVEMCSTFINSRCEELVCRNNVALEFASAVGMSLALDLTSVAPLSSRQSSEQSVQPALSKKKTSRGLVKKYFRTSIGEELAGTVFYPL